jgi:hypothetical protein
VAKGRRIVGAERQALGKELVRRYQAGESLRALADSTSRSYGFIHRVLLEQRAQLRRRGGPRSNRFRPAVISEERVRLATELRTRYEAGDSTYTLAREIGRSADFVRALLVEAGTTMRAPGGSPRWHTDSQIRRHR